MRTMISTIFDDGVKVQQSNQSHRTEPLTSLTFLLRNFMFFKMPANECWNIRRFYTLWLHENIFYRLKRIRNLHITEESRFGFFFVAYNFCLKLIGFNELQSNNCAFYQFQRQANEQNDVKKALASTCETLFFFVCNRFL